MNATTLTFFLTLIVTSTSLYKANHGLANVVAFARLTSSGRLASNSNVHPPHTTKCQRQISSRIKVFLLNTASPATLSENQNRLLARQYMQEGMELFRNGDVAKSIEYFNAAEQNDKSITPYLWQRGLSYYYNQQYEKASQQFRIDVSVNPYDVEEIVWDIASQLQSNRNQNQDKKAEVIFPILNQLSLPPGSKDRRRIMVRLLQRSRMPSIFVVRCARPLTFFCRTILHNK